METGFFDKNGILNLDEIVVNSDSFKNIMADGQVTDTELKQQVEIVVNHLHKLESICNEQQILEIRNSIAELSVLFAVYHYKTLQEVKR
jgi:transcription initiation factor IIE alpha subunit